MPDRNTNSANWNDKPASLVRDWNKRHRVGTDFRYFTPGAPSATVYRTSSSASILKMMTGPRAVLWGVELVDGEPKPEEPKLFDVRRCIPL